MRAASTGGNGMSSIGQLDVLRGLAIIMMIVNHFGERLPRFGYQPGTLLGAAIFLGSFAPAVFYFTTGFGIAIARDRPDPAASRSMLFKAAMLVAADQFMWWNDGKAYGLDFLAFIGLSTVLVTFIAYSKRSVWVASGLAAIALVLRFGLGWWLRNRLQLGGIGAWLIGTTPIANVSYPFSPWIVYPLLGFVFARCNRRQLTDGGFRLPYGLLLAMAACGGICAGVLYSRHADFFRWGTVSLGYFALSIIVLVAALTLAWMLPKALPRLAAAVSLRGIQSLAVVPIHYGLLGLCGALAGQITGSLAVFAAMSALIAGSIWLANVFSSAARALNRKLTPEIVLGMFAAIAISCAFLELARVSPAMFAAFVAGQLAITGMLSTRPAGQRRVPVLASGTV